MTIVAMGVLYSYFNSTVSKAEATAQVQVSANLAVPNGQGQGTIVVTVVNSGSIALTGLTISGAIVPSNVVWNPSPTHIREPRSARRRHQCRSLPRGHAGYGGRRLCHCGDSNLRRRRDAEPGADGHCHELIGWRQIMDA